MYEVITEWSTISGVPGLTVMYLNEADTIEVARSDLNDLWTGVSLVLADTTEWAIRTSGNVIDPATGELDGFWTDSTEFTGDGDGGASPVADATQLLIRWRTDSVVRGRRLQGRTFVPGLPTAALSGGNLDAADRTTVLTAANAFATSGTMGVWSRPQPGDAGLWNSTASADVWTELAVLRQRRG